MALADYALDLDALETETLALANDHDGERFIGSDTTDKTLLRDAINEAVREFALETELVDCTEYIALVADQADYDIIARIEAISNYRNYVCMKRVAYLDTGTYRETPGYYPTVQWISIEEFDKRGFNQKGTATEVTFYLTEIVTWGNMTLYPIPDTSGDVSAFTNVLKMNYTGLPNNMDGSSKDMDDLIPVIFHEYIPFGAAARLLENGSVEELALAAKLERQFREGVRIATREDFRNNTERLSLRPG
jgi:hypothetical protein